jgi:hypothetical protein
LPDLAPVLGALMAASVLAQDATRLARASGALIEHGQRPAAVLMSFSARLKQAGRGGDARRLTTVARQLWKETLAAQGLSVSDAELELLLAEAAGSAPETESRVA